MSKKPYSVHIHWRDGRTTVECETHDPVEATIHANHKVAKNPAVIQRIEIHDLDSSLETVWDRDWTSYA